MGYVLGLEGRVEMLDVDLVDLLSSCDLLQVVFVADIRIQRDLYFTVVYLLSYGAMGRPIAVYGRTVEFAYKLHIIAIIQLPKIAILDGIGLVTAEQAQFAVVR